MNIKAPPGVFDILPKDSKDIWKESHLWNYVEQVVRVTAAQFGFQEIRTPIFEKTELFQRGVGETTDIVSKEMYTFEDRGERMLSLRPEGTAPTIRSFIENNLAHQSPVHKLFYIGPMFRYERAQAGRYRQHHQFGAEVIGTATPGQDAEVIDLLYTTYKRLGLKNLQVMINSIGDQECRSKFREALKNYLKEHYEKLSADSKNRFEKNPLRILDSKDPHDQDIIKNAPSILDFLSPESRLHFEQVQEYLTLLNIPFRINPCLVRGLDYYNRTVFEVTAEELGAQNSIGGGGRYDTLIKQLGGPDLPALGFGTGIERIIQTMIKQEAPLPESYRPAIYFIPLGETAEKTCFKVLHELREERINAQMDFSGRKLGKVMQYANQIGAKFVAVAGNQEIESETIELKNMETGEKFLAPLYHLSRILRIESEGEDLLRIWSDINVPFDHPLEAKFFLDKLKSSIDHTQKLTHELQSAMEKMESFL
jgi:histidyl-tRNA synthetase